MFRKHFKTVSAKLANASKKDQPVESRNTTTIEIPTPIHTTPKGPSRLHGTNVQNLPGSKRKPPSQGESPDPGMTQMSDGRMDYQLRSDRASKHQLNGRFYDKPWPFKPKVAHA